MSEQQDRNPGLRGPRTVAVDVTPMVPGGENGGAKVFTLELVRQLARLVPATRFLLLTQSSSHEELASMDAANVSREMMVAASSPASRRPLWRRAATSLLRRLPTRAASRMRAAVVRTLDRKLLASLGAGRKLDLLYCPFTAPDFRMPGVPTVCTVHDLQWKEFPRYFSPEELWHRERAFAEACLHATALTVVSDFSRDAVLTHGDISPFRVRTIYSRMARRLPQPAPDVAMFAAHGLRRRGYLLYPANFWGHKNHERLLEAFGLARKLGLPPDLELVCTGESGAGRDRMERAAHHAGLGDSVRFPGFLPAGEYAALLAGSRGVIFPSLYEGFGLAVVEAMAVGVPVACSRTSSLPEVTGGAALYFDPTAPAEIASSMLELVSETASRRERIDAGFKRSLEFVDSQRMAREYWDVFCEAAGPSDGRQPREPAAPLRQRRQGPAAPRVSARR